MLNTKSVPCKEGMHTLLSTRRLGADVVDSLMICETETTLHPLQDPYELVFLSQSVESTFIEDVTYSQSTEAIFMEGVTCTLQRVLIWHVLSYTEHTGLS